MWPIHHSFLLSWFASAKPNGVPVCQPQKIGAKLPRHIPEPNHPRSGKRKRRWR